MTKAPGTIQVKELEIMAIFHVLDFMSLAHVVVLVAFTRRTGIRWPDTNTRPGYVGSHGHERRQSSILASKLGSLDGPTNFFSKTVSK
jgi:hypothetical protein